MIKGSAQTFFKLVEKKREREKALKCTAADINNITLFYINAIK